MPKLPTRYARLDAIERSLAHDPHGRTTSSLATEFGVDPDTIRRDLVELEYRGTGLIKEGRRYLLDHRRQLHSVKLTHHEVMALYVAARLLSHHSDEHNPHVTNALDKLADALAAKSPRIARHIAQAASVVGARQPRETYVQALEAMTQGWAEGRKVLINYRSAKGETSQRLFCPYFIEPSGIGYTCYVIGHDELRGTLRTLKIERISDAVLTQERFEVPSSFDPQQLIDSAWGIIWPEEGQVEIALHFQPAVVRRLKESTWHHTQRIEDLPDGSCLFTVRVGSTLEIKPWVRQWGADVVVVSPEAFRREIAEEAQRTTQLYR